MHYRLRRCRNGASFLGTYIALVQRLVRDRTGATAIEYGLIVGAIGAAIIGVVFLIGNDLAIMYGQIENLINSSFSTR